VLPAGEKEDQGLYSVDIAEYLTKKGLSYEEAHDAVGKLMNYCYTGKRKIKEMELSELKKFSSKFEQSIYSYTFTPKKSVDLKKSIGGTAIKKIKSQIIKNERMLKNA
jgi:argininosuccinate lyase